MTTIKLTQPGDYSYTLDKSGEKLDIVGSFWLKGHDQFTLNLKVIHAAPHTKAKVTLRAVVDDQAHIDLNGLVIVNPAAQGTDSVLSEKVLLLSKSATATAIPNLEILANDVKCTHAATVGPIDEEQLFYLTSRGISSAQAKTLLAQGFLDTNKYINNI
jgi:Fe-S cluster assembly protein SufD